MEVGTNDGMEARNANTRIYPRLRQCPKPLGTHLRQRRNNGVFT